MTSIRVIAVSMVLALGGCSKAPEDDVRLQLDMIRALEVQSTLISVEAACSEPADRALLVDGALALLRRATAGREMARIHKMMGNMNMDKPGDMPEKTGPAPESPQQAMHIAVHLAGGDEFDLLDAMTRPPGLGCAQLRPVSLAATAAALRQQHESNATRDMDKILDTEVDRAADKLGNAVQASITDETPDVVRKLALALQKI
jgi:hypothetical protein